MSEEKEPKQSEPHVSSGKWVSPTKGKAQTVPSKHNPPAKQEHPKK